MTEREISYGSLASISACPQHVRLGGNLGNAGCPVLSVGGIGCHPNKPRGVARVDNRRVLNSIFWVLALKCDQGACPPTRRLGQYSTEAQSQRPNLLWLTTVFRRCDVYLPQADLEENMGDYPESD